MQYHDNPDSDYEVLIVGGGMVGATLACALGATGLRIAVLESAPLERLQPGPTLDVRVSAINRAAQRIFAALGAWEGMTAWRVSPFREMRVWDAAGSGQIHFDSADLGEPLLGWIIENRVIQAALLEQAQHWPDVTLLSPASLATIHERPLGGWHVRLTDGRVFTTRLLVGADGGQSPVRRLAGIETFGWEYDQSALVANVRSAEPHQETAWQRFLPTGPLAFLPLHDGCCSIVWSVPPQQAQALLALPEADFSQALAEAFGFRLGAIVEVGPRLAFPLRLQHARSYTRPGLALIGDAAHVVHPLAGQGVNLGVLDAACLAEVVMEAIATGAEIGALRTLRRYERWRKGENLLMLGLMDAFKRGFGPAPWPLRQVRNLGLNLTDAIGPIKQRIARRAMGLDGDLPRLAQAVEADA